MMYKDGGTFEFEGNFYTKTVVNSQEEETEHLGNGWKHKPMQGDGLEEEYKLRKENEESKKRIAELESMLEQKKIDEQKQENPEPKQEELPEQEELQEEQENPEPKRKGRPRKAE